MASVWTMFLAFAITSSCLVYVESEVFTAIFEMENLVYREREMVDALKDYLKQEEERLDKIRRFTHKIDQLHATMGDIKIEEYLGHPTNSFLLIKRFVNEWDNVETLAKTTANEDLTAALDVHRHNFPDDKDLDGAIDAIFRVQEIYKVSAQALSSDLVPSQTRAQLMNVSDIITIAKHAYFADNYKKAQEWYNAALIAWDEGRHGEDDEIVEIWDYLSFVEYKLGNIKRAYNLTLRILMTEPTHERAQKNLKYYANELKENGHLTGKRSVLSEDDVEEDDDDEQNVVNEEAVDWKSSRAYKRYQKLCRGDADALHNNSLAELRQLKCWFHHVPWLRLRGIGIERLHVTPEVIYYRNVLTDDEVDKIKTLGRPKVRYRAVLHESGCRKY